MWDWNGESKNGESKKWVDLRISPFAEQNFSFAEQNFWNLDPKNCSHMKIAQQWFHPYVIYIAIWEGQNFTIEE
mgnify:FL=1